MTILIDKLTPRGFANRHFLSWDIQRLDALGDTYAADVVYRDLSLGVEAHGLDELRAFFRSALEAPPDMCFETLDVIAESSERLAVKWRMTGTSNGAAFSTEGVSWMRLVDGKVTDNTDYYK